MYCETNDDEYLSSCVIWSWSWNGKNCSTCRYLPQMKTYKTVSYQIDGCIHIWRILGDTECRALQCCDNLCGVAVLNLKIWVKKLTYVSWVSFIAFTVESVRLCWKDRPKRRSAWSWFVSISILPWGSCWRSSVHHNVLHLIRWTVFPMCAQASRLRTLVVQVLDQCCLQWG